MPGGPWGLLEVAAELAGRGGDGSLGRDWREALQHRFAVYDKSGEEHYNLISALHKSIRGSDRMARCTGWPGCCGGGGSPLPGTPPGAHGLGGYRAGRPRGAGRCDRRPGRPITSSGSPEGESGPGRGGGLPRRLRQNPIDLSPGMESGDLSARRRRRPPIPGATAPAERAHLRRCGSGATVGNTSYDPDEPGGVASQEYLPEASSGTAALRSEREIRLREDRSPNGSRGGGTPGGCARDTIRQRIRVVRPHRFQMACDAREVPAGPREPAKIQLIGRA
jgi:hypothetical protein